MGFPVDDLRNYFGGNKRVNTPGGIHSPDSFRLILERERARTERTGHTFSLVLFGCNQGQGNDTALLERLGTVLVQKVRLIDEVGWYEEGKTMGALLPGTSVEGASQFIEIIRQKIGEEASILEYKIYIYPNSLIDSGRCTESADQGNPSTKFMASISESSGFSHFPPLNGKSVRSMESLFARPIPYWKRLIDILASTLLLVCLTPLFLLVALFIKIVSPGPVFHRQERIGYLGRKFTFWKFRTMHVNNDATGHRQYLGHLIENDAPMTKMDDVRDDRIIPFGMFLRNSCIDELPQLINVLKGEMSLVGPRPCLAYEAEKYSNWHTRRFDTVPGMTGLWQVSGKNRTTFKEMIRFDIRYSRKMSPGLDAKILLLTGPTIFGMVSDPLSRKTTGRKETPSISPSHRERSIRG
jgi:lipopolysaccharide/colanic/teichoic acid biosynthesis glycosyltransferase